MVIVCFGMLRMLPEVKIAASKNATLIRCGERPTTIGDYTTINSPSHGKPIQKHRKFLDKAHLDIVFGDCMALGGFRYALVLVDVATRFTWVYGLTSLSPNDIYRNHNGDGQYELGGSKFFVPSSIK